MNLPTLILILNLTSFLIIRIQSPSFIPQSLATSSWVASTLILLFYLIGFRQNIKATIAINPQMSVDLNNRQPSLERRAGKGPTTMLEDP